MVHMESSPTYVLVVGRKKKRKINMNIFKHLKHGDKVFIIDNNNKINEIKIDLEHITKNIDDRRPLFKNYRIKSRFAKFGRIKLVRTILHEEMFWNKYHYLKKWYEYEKTDKVAYLSLRDAEKRIIKTTPIK